MEIQERERALRTAVVGFRLEVRRALLHVILAPEDQRAEAIGRLWALRPNRSMAELLMDLEEDRLIALDVAEALKASIR